MINGNFIPEIFYLANVLLGCIGFYIAYKVAKSKKKQEKLICSFHHKCDEVVNSKYSKIFGIDLTILGRLYYLFVVVSYISLEVFDDFNFNSILIKVVFVISILAAIFSWYLISLMYFVIKEKCDWCLGSAFISNAIAFLSILAYYFM